MLMAILEKSEPAEQIVDDKLMGSIADGSMEALRALYDCTSKSIYAFAISITRNTCDAEDVLQETFLTVFQKAGRYAPQGKPMAWIYTIARNFALMKLRERGKTGIVEDSQVQSSAAFGQIESIEARFALQKSLYKLDGEERQILLLHAMSGLKNREIALVLGIPLNTVLSKYHRTVKKMRNLLESEGFSK